jgi:putative transposase
LKLKVNGYLECQDGTLGGCLESSKEHQYIEKFSGVLEVVLRPEGARGFVLLQKRWMVEQTYGWLHWCRRLNMDYERLPASSEAFIYVAMIRLTLRRLA